MKTLTNRRENAVIIIMLLIIVFIASLPAFRNGVYNGFDLWFHMGRIESIATELSNGQFPVRYETESWYGNGYISTTMYGNILLYIPAILHQLGLATYKCYNIYVILTNLVGTCIAMYSFTRIFRDKRWGLIATEAYMLAGYYISNIYVRAALGEYTATIFIPLVVYGLYRILYENTDKGIVAKTIPLVLGVTGLIQTHILTTYMVAMMTLVFLLVFIKDTWKHIKELVISLLMIITLNAFFLVPFLDSYLSYEFRAEQTSVGTNIQKYGLYLDQILGLFPEGHGGRTEWSSQGEESGRIGIVMVIFLLLMLFLVIASKRYITDEKRESFKRISCIFGIGILAAWLSSAFFPWDIFSGDNFISNIMRGVQYPSRYMVIQTIAWTICGTYALKILCEQFKEKKEQIFSISLIFMFFVLAIIQNGIFMYTLSCRNLTVQTIEGHEMIADDLYLLNGIDVDNVESTPHVLRGNDCYIEDLGYDGLTRKIYVENNSSKSATVLIPVFCYKYIDAYTSSGEEYELSQTQNYQYQLDVEAGFSDTLEIEFNEPITWRMSEAVSLVSIILLVILFVRGNKKYSHA